MSSSKYGQMNGSLLDSNEAIPHNGKLEVRLNRRYLPGSGPALPRPRLMLAHDTDAYIVDRILMPSPGPAKDGKPLPKQMMYIVGWKSEPAARVNVPVMKVLDYVAPHVLEQWEYEAELRLEEKREAKEAAELLGKTEVVPKRKPGRPKSKMQMESAMTVASDTDEAGAEKWKPGPMSLVTPTRRRFADFAETPDFEESPTRNPDLAPTSAALDAENDVYMNSAGMPNDDWSESDMEDYGTPELPPDTPLMSRQQRPSTVPVYEMWRQNVIPGYRSDGTNVNSAAPGPPPPICTQPITNNQQEARSGRHMEAVDGLRIEESPGGKRLRCFHVRWNSTSPGERTTWEYEGNVPPNLIEEYLTKVEARSPVRPGVPLRQTTLSWSSQPKPGL